MTEFAAPRVDPRTLKVSYGDEKDWVVEFRFEPVFMEALSEIEGRPIYHDRIFCRKMRGGDTKTVWDTLAVGVEYDSDGNWRTIEDLPNGAEPDHLRFPKAWAVFEKRADKATTGWPIEEWGAISKSFAETLKGMNIRTVEQLSGLTDQQAGSFMGGNKFRNMAKAALDSAEASAQISRAEHEKRERDEQIEQLRKTVEDLKQALETKKHRKDAA